MINTARMNVAAIFLPSTDTLKQVSVLLLSVHCYVHNHEDVFNVYQQPCGNNHRSSTVSAVAHNRVSKHLCHCAFDYIWQAESANPPRTHTHTPSMYHSVSSLKLKLK